MEVWKVLLLMALLYGLSTGVFAPIEEMGTDGECACPVHESAHCRNVGPDSASVVKRGRNQ